MKRIIAVILCLSIVLSGCQNKKGSVDIKQPEQNMTVTVTPAPDVEESGTDENTVVKLLQLNKAWSLIQTVQLEQPSYEVPYYKANVKPYQIAEDLSNVENINQYDGFNKEQLQLLAENGFIVLPGNSTRTYYVYDDNEYKGIPNFITSDSVLHLYHQFYDKSLMSIEINYLYDDLNQMTERMLTQSILLWQQLTDEKLKALQEKNIIYFLVGRMLFLQSTDTGITVDNALLGIAKQEYELAQAAQGISRSPLFDTDLDYSQFTVRGHYTRSEELKTYFKAMMWFGYSGLAFVDKDKNILYDNVLQALLISYSTVSEAITGDSAGQTCAAQLWSDIYQPTAQYVGLSDDINVFTMNGLRSEVYGENANPDNYNDEAYLDKLTEAVKALPEPQIQAKITQSDTPTGKQFKFMGQRYILDSEVMQKLMEPILRPLPSALDVMGVLGSSTAEELLFSHYKPQDSWPEYTPAYEKLKYKVAGLDAQYWRTNLYNGWLWTIQEELKEYSSDSGMPYFMTTEAWEKKELNTALASYTELKHDTVLYGKQGAAEMGGPLATAQQQYVEPKVELYYKLLYLTKFTCSVLEEKGMLNEALRSGADSYQAFLKLLIDCSIKELNNDTLTDDEIKQLLWSGGTMESIMMDFLKGVTEDSLSIDPTDMLVTDVATCQNTYLSLATGYFDDIYVVVPYGGKLYLSRGSVYSFYEFNSNQRLTDEAWWALQGIKVVHEDYGDYTELGEASKDLPAQPDWITSFKLEKNNVIITSLETLWGNLEE